MNTSHEETGGFAAMADEVAQATLLDVRRAPTFAQATSMIPGARWCDPATVERWASSLPPGQPVIVYCVHGHEVSQTTAQRLREAGLPARYLAGGLEAWAAAGRPVVPKPAG